MNTRYASLGAVVAVGLLGIAGLLVYEHYGHTPPDWVTYQAAAGRWLSGEPVYTAMQMQPYPLNVASYGRGYVYPPTALLAIPTFLPVDVWRVLNMAALVVAFGLLTRWWLAPLALAIPFAWNASANAQVTPLLILLLAVMYVRPRWSGPLAAVGGLVKLFPLAGLVWAWRHERWRGVAKGLATLAALVLVTWPFVGHLWPDFIRAQLNAQPSCAVSAVNSLSCASSPLVAYALAGILALMAAVIPDERTAFAVLGMAILAALPDLNWFYWLVPIYCLLPLLGRAAEPVNQGFDLRRPSRRLRPAEDQPHPVTGGRERLGT